MYVLNHSFVFRHAETRKSHYVLSLFQHKIRVQTSKQNIHMQRLVTEY